MASCCQTPTPATFAAVERSDGWAVESTCSACGARRTELAGITDQREAVGLAIAWAAKPGRRYFTAGGA